MDKDYSKRELDTQFKYIAEKLDLIHEQTSKTNGRVTRLESDGNEIKLWKANLMGKIAVVTFIMAGIASVLIGQVLK